MKRSEDGANEPKIVILELPRDDRGLCVLEKNPFEGKGKDPARKVLETDGMTSSDGLSALLGEPVESARNPSSLQSEEPQWVGTCSELIREPAKQTGNADEIPDFNSEAEALFDDAKSLIHSDLLSGQ